MEDSRPFEKEREKRTSARRKGEEVEAHTRDKYEPYRELYKASVEENWREDRNAFVRAGVIEGWLESNPQPDVTGYLRDLIELHFKGLLQNPEAKKGKKFKYKDRQRDFARRMLGLSEERR